MNKNLTSYLIPKLEKFLDDEYKLDKYLRDNFKAKDFKGFEEYLKVTSNEDYELYSKVVLDYSTGFNPEFFNINKNLGENSTNDKTEGKCLVKFIFSDKNLRLSLKRYLRLNPLSVLVHSDEFLCLIGNFVSPHIQNCPGVIFVDLDDNVSLFLNNTTRPGYISINLSFLKICINTLLNMYSGGSCELHMSINNNKLTMQYGSSIYNCILVNKNDMNGVFNSFGYANNKEKLLAVDIFYDKDISYEFFIFYFSRIHRYTSEKYSIFQMWVVEKYSSIMNIPYFKRIAEEYSVGISVLMHSICPFSETYEYAQQLNPVLNDKNRDSYAFSLALWLYNKRGYYYDNKIIKNKKGT